MRENIEEKRVLKEIISRIVSHYFSPGDRLIESEIAAEFGVSRTPVRNALKRLVAEGLLDTKPKKGCFIPFLTPVDMEQVFEIRSNLEGMAARAAAQNVTQEDVEKLQDILKKEQEDLSPDYVEKFRYINKELHMTILDMSKNVYLKRFVKVVFSRSELYSFFLGEFYLKAGNQITKASGSKYGKSKGEHLALVEAIISGDGNNAEQIMKKHILQTYARLRS